MARLMGLGMAMMGARAIAIATVAVGVGMGAGRAIAALPGALPIAQGEELTLESLLRGDLYPTSKPLSSFDSDWRIVTVVGQPETASMMRFTGAMFGIGPNNFYTRGETVQLGGETFVVAYRQPQAQPGVDMGPDLAVSLSLINLRMTASLNDLTPFSLPDELSRLRQQGESPSGFPFPFPTQPNPMPPAS